MAEDIALAATTQQLEATRAQLAEQQAHNRKLLEDLDRTRAMKQDVKVEKETVMAPLAIFFTINRANITARDKVNLKYVAETNQAKSEQSLYHYRICRIKQPEHLNSTCNSAVNAPRMYSKS